MQKRAQGEPSSRVVHAFTILALSGIFLQKLGLTFGGSGLGLDAVILWGVLAWLFACGDAVIDAWRAGWFLAVVYAVLLSLYIAGHITSLPAVLVFLGMYATMLFVVEVDEPTFRRAVTPFQTGMLCAAWIVIGQQLLQYTVGNAYWPNLERIVPKFLLLEDFAYFRPYAWRSPYLVPNGVFFLEPSAVSSFLALSFGLEVIWFKRLRRLLVLGSALLGGMAGSGVAVVVLFSPLLIGNMGHQLRRWTLGVGIPLLIVGAVSGVFSRYLDRSSEFSQSTGSAHQRVTVPFETARAVLSDSEYLFTGNGPGTSPKSTTTVEWPVSKLGSEYGALTTLVFHVFILVAILAHPVSRTLALMVLVPHLFFGGGFVTHTNVMMLVMWGSLLRVKPAPHPMSQPQARPALFPSSVTYFSEA